MFAKKILKYIFALFLLIGAFTFYEISDISSKYINRSLITFDINNARNPQIKKMLRFFDNIYAYTLLSLSEKHKSHFNQEDLIYEKLPEEKIIIGKKKDFTLSVVKDNSTSNDWHRSHGSNPSNRFSYLKKINLSNVNKLGLAWTFAFDEIKNDIQIGRASCRERV